MALPIDLDALSLHSSVLAGEPLSEDVVVRLRVHDLPERPRPPLAAVLVIDTSGSMAGEPIAHVKRAARRLAELLDDDDQVAIVCFESEATTACELTELGGGGRARVTQAVEALLAYGGTNMSGGLARSLLLFPADPGERRQMLLLMSDGHANVGTSSAEGLAAEAAAIKARGVGISTLGFGAHHGEDTLIAIADAGGGRYGFVADPRLADAAFVRAVGAQRDVVAENLHLLLKPAEGVEIARVLGDPKTSFGAGGLRVQLPDAIAGDEINVVVELSIAAPREAGPWRPLAIEAVATPLGKERPERLSAEVALDLSRLPSPDVSQEVAVLAAVARAAEARDEARALADRGSFAAAASVLRAAVAAVEATPGFDPAGTSDLVDVRETLLDDITAMENRPDPESYAKFRKAQRAYSDFASGGTRGKSHVARTRSAVAMEARGRAKLPRARLVAREGGAELLRVPLDRPDMTVGRTSDNDVVLPRQQLSRRHSRILFSEGEFWLIDLCSTNGTVVNGALIERGHPLAPGDVIHYGDLEVVFETDPDEED